MATIKKREKGGTSVYRVKIRRKGYPTQTATFPRKTDAKKWAQITEAAMEEGRYFKTTQAKRHTLAEMVDRYIATVLPDKSPSSIYMQTQQLRWWREQLGTYVLADVTSDLIAECRDTLAEGNGQPFSDASLPDTYSPSNLKPGKQPELAALH